MFTKFIGNLTSVFIIAVSVRILLRYHLAWESMKVIVFVLTHKWYFNYFHSGLKPSVTNIVILYKDSVKIKHKRNASCFSLLFFLCFNNAWYVFCAPTKCAEFICPAYAFWDWTRSYSTTSSWWLSPTKRHCFSTPWTVD